MHHRIDTILKQLRQDVAQRLDPESIQAACEDAAHTWRKCPLNPVAILLICVHGNFDVLVGLWVLLFAISLSRWARLGDPVDWLGASLWLGIGALTKTTPIVLLPLLGVGWRRLRPAAILLGAILAIGPALLALSIVYALGPAQVTAHVFQYQSVPGVFGFTGLLHMAGQEGLDRLYTRAFLVFLILSGLAVLAWAMVRGTQYPRGVELGAAILLMAIPALGPGYAPQYAYWFLPLLVLTFGSVHRGTKVLIAVWYVVASITYIGEYAVIPDLGAIAPPTWARDLVVLNNASVESAVTIWRIPLFIAYLGVILGLIVSMLRPSELWRDSVIQHPAEPQLVDATPSA